MSGRAEVAAVEAEGCELFEWSTWWPRRSRWRWHAEYIKSIDAAERHRATDEYSIDELAAMFLRHLEIGR